jgi:hypothetical protein
MDWMVASPPNTAALNRPKEWWEKRWFVAAVILATMIPLLYPPIPPLVDLLGHMGRYRVSLDLGTSPTLSQYYAFEWKIVGNLGVDLLVVPLAKLFGLELATKLIVLAIPPLTAAGMLWVAREVHYRLPPTALFALPFITGHHFLFGFVNYALSMAFAFLAFGLWLRLGRLGKSKLRATLFVPISIVIWLTHTFGWGILGLLAFASECIRQHDNGRGWLMSAPRAAFHCLSLAAPLLLMIAWREHGGGVTLDWFNWKVKWQWIVMALRDRWRLYDQASVGVTAAVLLFAVAHPRLALSRMLLFTVMILLVAYAILPRIIFGSAYADMRIVPFIWAIALLAIRFKGSTDLRLAGRLAAVALAFFVARTASVTWSLAMAANEQRAQLTALDQVPMGARVVSMVGIPCQQGGWPLWRNAHLGGLVVVRRQGFSNDHWDVPGAKLLTVTYRAAGDWRYDPSNLVRDPHCRLAAGPIGERLARFPALAFDYLWLIDPPPYDPALTAGYAKVWSGPNGSALYRLPGSQANNRP